MYGISPEFLKKYAHGVSNQGHRYLGAHVIEWEGQKGVRFLVYAPHARQVHVASNRNDWSTWTHALQRIEEGFFVGFFPMFIVGDYYKYVIHSEEDHVLWKADPYAFFSEKIPGNASRIYDLNGYIWHDESFAEEHAAQGVFDRPISIYEVNLATWRRWNGTDYFTFEQFIDQLVPYVRDLGYTHVEIMPVTEYPFDGSWGYQQTGYFSITSRFGEPKEFMKLIDSFHQNGVGVILDWVPCHYPKDSHGLAYFDGKALYESDFWHDAYNSQWDTMNFDYGRRHVCNFFLSNALFLREFFHIDGLRMDAVAYMVHKSFGENGSQETYNHAAIAFIKEVNIQMGLMAGFLMFAEESSAFYGVSRSLEEGGLGFHYKWNMGWMNDTLSYMVKSYQNRQYFHEKLTFPMMYAFSEHFVLPLSHDEVVHMKRSLVDKMPGYYDDKFAQLRLLYLYQYTQPGKKLLFMGGEFAQFKEWNEYKALDWNLLDFKSHMNMLQYVRELNALYRAEPALYTLEDDWQGFEWIEADNAKQNLLIYKRRGKDKSELIIALNFSPFSIHHHYIEHTDKNYRVLLNSDEERFYGKNLGSHGILTPHEGRLHLDIPPYGGVILKEDV